MRRIAVAVVGALISTAPLVADQFLPPYLSIADKQGPATANSAPFIGPAPSNANEPSLGKETQQAPLKNDETSSKPALETSDFDLTKNQPAEIQPFAKPPFVNGAMAPPQSNFSALSVSPAGFRFWAGSEALLWGEKNEHLPANVVTTGLTTDAVPGALGQPNTLGLSGPGNVNFGPFAGVRLFGGTWLDPQQILGVEASGFVLQQQGQGFTFNSTVGGNPLLALRHLDAFTGMSDAFVIAAPSARSGGIAVQSTSQLWGADAHLLHTFLWTPCFRLVGLFGFRYLDLSEGLSIQTRTMGIDGSAVSFLGQPFAAPAYELTADRFHARSQFFGGQVGVRGEYYFSHFFVSATGKLALGQTDEVVNALGVSTLQIGNTPLLSAAGGLFALPSNSGHFVNPDFGIVPELQLKGGVLLTRWLRATIGYNVLFWNRVQRAGDSLDLSVDNRQVPTSPSYQAGVIGHSPQPMFNTSSFWVQGLTLGLEFTY